MNITLTKPDGSARTYTQFFIPLKFLRKAMEIKQSINIKEMTLEDVDTILNFAVEVFDHQFTFEELEQGIPYEEFNKRIFNHLFVKILYGQNHNDDESDEGSEGNGKK